MYITAEQFTQFTGRNAGDEDLLAGMYAAAACDIVNDYLGYNPEESEREIILDGNGTNQLSLDVKPVTAVASIIIDGVAVDASVFAVREQYLFRFDGGVFSSGTGNIIVRCTAGYKVMPGIIKMTALRIAGVLAAEGDGNIGIQSKSFGESGSRVFLSSRFDKYLEAVEKYRVYKI